MKSLIIFAAIAACSFATAQVDRSVMPKPAAATSIDIKDAYQFRLPNGITVLVSENHKLPRVTWNLTMGASPSMEGMKAGASAMLGQVLMSGTQKRNKAILDKEIDFIGASLDAGSSNVSMTCLKKHMPTALDLMQDVLMNPLFSQEEFDKIKTQFKDNLDNSKTSPESMADNVSNKVNFPRHPYGEIMNEASLAAIELNDVRKSYKDVFTPQGAYLVIVGDITPKEAEEMALKMFGSWSGATLYNEDPGFGMPVLGNRVIFVKKPGAVQSVITVTFPLQIKSGSKDEIAFKVLNSIMGGGAFGSRFFQNLREDKAWTYGAYTDLNINRYGSSISGSGSFRNEVTDSAIMEMLYEFKRITEDYVTDEEMNLTKASMTGQFARSMESPSTIASFSLNILRNKLDKNYYRDYLKMLESITKDDVLDVAQKYLTSGYNIVVVGSEEVLPKLKALDSDGKIEILDAFGDEIIEMKKTDITPTVLISKYLNAVSITTSPKKLKKKAKKIKSVVKSVELSNPQIPMKIAYTDVNVFPMKEATRIEANGMVLQSSYFDGVKGANSNMQTGSADLTPAEIEEKKKRAGLFPEMNYALNGVMTEVKGIEVIDGVDYYVLSSKVGENEQLDYFDTKTYLKYKTVSFVKQENEVVEQATIFSDYKEVNGILFAHKIQMGGGGLSFNGEVKSITINGEIKEEWFK